MCTKKQIKKNNVITNLMKRLHKSNICVCDILGQGSFGIREGPIRQNPFYRMLNARHSTLLGNTTNKIFG